MKRKSLLLTTIFILSLFITIPVSVNAKVKINKKSITLTVNQKTKLKVKGTKKKVKWKSKNKSIATVNQKGKVTTKAAGKTKIIATVGKKKYKCKVTVKKTPERTNSNNETAIRRPDTHSALDSRPDTTPTEPSTPKIGSRENPYTLSNSAIFSFINDYGTYSTLSLQLMECIEGEEPYQIICDENGDATVPGNTNRWVLYHYKLDYITGTDEIQASEIINEYSLYNPDGTVYIGELFEKENFFYNNLKGLGAYDVRLYPGGSSDVWFGILLDNSISTDTMHRLYWYDNDSNRQEIWFRNA